MNRCDSQWHSVTSPGSGNLGCPQAGSHRLFLSRCLPTSHNTVFSGHEKLVLDMLDICVFHELPGGPFAQKPRRNCKQSRLPASLTTACTLSSIMHQLTAQRQGFFLDSASYCMTAGSEAANTCVPDERHLRSSAFGGCQAEISTGMRASYAHLRQCSLTSCLRLPRHQRFISCSL